MSRGRARKKERIWTIVRVVLLVLDERGWALSSTVTDKLQEVQGWKGFSARRIRRELWDLYARGYLLAGEAHGFLYWRPSERTLQNCGFPGMPDELRPRLVSTGKGPRVSATQTASGQANLDLDFEEGGGEMATAREEREAREAKYLQIQTVVARLGGDAQAVPTARLYDELATIPGCEGLKPWHMGKVLMGAADAGFIRREGTEGNYAFSVTRATDESLASMAAPPAEKPSAPVPAPAPGPAAPVAEPAPEPPAKLMYTRASLEADQRQAQREMDAAAKKMLAAEERTFAIDMLVEILRGLPREEWNTVIAIAREEALVPAIETKK